MKFQGRPLEDVEGRFKFHSRYGCHGTLYFWLVEPKLSEVYGQPDFEAAKKVLMGKFHTRGERHVYYYPMVPKEGER